MLKIWLRLGLLLKFAIGLILLFGHDSTAYYRRETLIQEGVAVTAKSSQLTRESSFSSYSDTDEESKVHKLLGGGKGWYVTL